MSGNKKAKRAAANQNAANAKTTAENNARIARAEKEKYRDNIKYQTQQYGYNKKNFATEAGNTAREKVTADRVKAINDSGKLLTDFEKQEKMRRLHSRQGTGQVTAEDEFLNEADRQGAIDLLNRGSDYWDSKRQVAYDDAYTAADSGYEGSEGSLQDFLKENVTDVPASYQAGRDYQGRGTKQTAPASNTTSNAGAFAGLKRGGLFNLAAFNAAKAKAKPKANVGGANNTLRGGLFGLANNQRLY